MDDKDKAAIRLLMESKTSFRPYYDKGADTWRVDFPDRDSEWSGVEIVNSLFGLFRFDSLFICPEVLCYKASGHIIKLHGV